MPEEKKTFTVRRGGRVEIGIAGDSEETARPSLPDEGRRPGAPHVDDEDDPLFRRLKKGALVFFDLGTRLRSVPASTDFEDFTRTRTPEPAPEPNDGAGHFNEYLEIEIDGEAENLRRLVRPPYLPSDADDYALGLQHVNADVPEAIHFEFDAACLGSLREGSTDPVSPLEKFKANGSGRELPACAPVPYVETVEDPADYHESDDYPTEAFDFILYSEEETLTFPNTTVRETVRDLRAWANDEPGEEDDEIDVHSVWESMTILDNSERWKEREHEDGEASERWSPHNLTGGEAKKGAEHSQKGQGGRFSLKLDSRLIYEPFDTGDAENFKVTREPDFESEEAAFAFLSGRPTRVFLRPSLLCFGRSETWKAFVYSAVESHSWQDDDAEPPYVHHKAENYQDNYSGGLTMDVSVTSVYDAAATPQTFTVTVTKIPSGFGTISATVSGTPSGDGTYTWTAGFNQQVTAAPGIRLYLFFDAGIPNGTFISLDVSPDWLIFQRFLDIDAAMIRGMHVGRWPFLPRAGGGGWDSGLTWNGESGYSYTDDAGTLIVYDPNIWPTKTGRTAFHDGERSRMLQVYERHAERDGDRLVYLVRPVTGFGFHTLGLGISEAQARAIAGTNTAGGVLPVATARATLTAQAEADAQQVAEGIAALLGAAARNPVGGVNQTRIENPGGFAVVVPPYEVPAGVLCGIIEHGSAVFYVWRRTPETRGGYDFDRNQGSFRLPFTVPEVENL